jgi:hypothetical protein
LLPNFSTSFNHFDRLASVEDLIGEKDEIFTGLKPENSNTPTLTALWPAFL